MRPVYYAVECFLRDFRKSWERSRVWADPEREETVSVNCGSQKDRQMLGRAGSAAVSGQTQNERKR
jgi:hypothetical protein